MTTTTARRPVRREFRNDKAVFLWGFTAVWFAMLVAFTYIAVRDGGIPQTGVWGWPVLALFWLAGFGLARWASTLPRVHVALTPDGVIVRERFPFSTNEKRYLARDLAAPRIDDGKDSDGDPYYT
ncbi:MAG TPA: hypothetical protein VJ724_13750, partial [Tahibacter sp.]|nr:hypothetical protein [Tahibacter sp.]